MKKKKKSLNWAFIEDHAWRGAFVGLFAVLPFSIPWLLVVGNAIFWFVREAWDHRDVHTGKWDFRPGVSDLQVIGEWLAPSLTCLATVILMGLIT